MGSEFIWPIAVVLGAVAVIYMVLRMYGGSRAQSAESKKEAKIREEGQKKTKRAGEAAAARGRKWDRVRRTRDRDLTKNKVSKRPRNR